jgi:prepilin-type N-terminal cleavage/methylation domain-containing protein
LAKSDFSNERGLVRRSSPKRSAASEGGFSLIEVLVATVILTTGLMALGQLFAMSVAANSSAKSTTFSTVLAEQKLEQLRALTWGFDAVGLPLSDTTSDTSVDPIDPLSGTGLTPSPPDALQGDIDGYHDFVDRNGSIVGNGAVPPAGSGALYFRRWSIEPLPTNPNNTLIIQVLVGRIRDRGDANQGSVARMAEEARVITVKTRKAQ